jgi:hypothetical protein
LCGDPSRVEQTARREAAIMTRLIQQTGGDQLSAEIAVLESLNTLQLSQPP